MSLEYTSRDMPFEQIRGLGDELRTDRMQYMQTKILLSSLEEIISSGQLPDAIASKIKKVLLFGNLTNYLDVQETERDLPVNVGKLIGILTNEKYERLVELTEDEKQVVLVTLRDNVMQKNRLVYEMYNRFLPNGTKGASEENLIKLLECLKAEVTPGAVWEQHKDIASDVRKCYQELEKCETMLNSLAVMKLNAGEPFYSSVKKVNELDAKATESKSKEILGELKNELLSDDGAAAMEIIHSKQREEMEAKMLNLKRLREEVSQYENLRSEGFDGLLKEYMDVLQRRKDKEKLKEDYIQGFEGTEMGTGH
ncbi:uncharacterized protein [Hetaerina americana]|uniref:uncharacterized protein isoform X2 n=1 Tax=Hetaerina americana TaxID=62018 RepID=UPI003A7F2DF5